IVVVLNNDAIPILLPEVCHPNTLVSFSETIADHLQYADYALATSAGVARDLGMVAERFLSRSMAMRVIKLGADFAPQGEPWRRRSLRRFLPRAAFALPPLGRDHRAAQEPRAPASGLRSA